MKFDYEELYYLKARGADDRRPAESWGGYGQDFTDADSVYTHSEVEDARTSDWLLNGIQDLPNMQRQLLIFDLDIYKAPDGFDADRVEVPANTPIVRSQSGGIHVYFVVNTPTRAQEGDFTVAEDLPFDIDIRGEFVKHHVVAPGDVSGVESGYELTNDASISHVFDPREAAKTITFDGKPALSYNPGTRAGGGYEREDVDPPDDMPKCFAAGLSLRKEAPDDPNLNTHKVNVLTALSGLAAGYEVETVVDLFVDDYYPGDAANADREMTEYQVQHIAEKLDRDSYSPPTVPTLQQYGILPFDEWCECGLPKHDAQGANKSVYYSLNLDDIAMGHGIGHSPYEDNLAMLKTCLIARDESEKVNGEKPPYAALVGVAEEIGLPMEEPEDNILGETTYNVARRMYDDLAPTDV